MKKIALKYLNEGFSVIPVGSDKKPKIAWIEFQKRHATEEEVEKWWTTWPDANIGIVTGEISGITVIDVEKGGSVTGLPMTKVAKTGGEGWHYYYKYEPGIGNKARIKELMDIRGEGGYVVAPPSKHASGNCYEWAIEDADLEDFPVSFFDVKNNSSNELKNTDWGAIAGGVSSGGRNNSAAQYIGKLIKAFKTEEWKTLVWPTVKKWNESNVPPLPEFELKNTFISICKKEYESKKKENTQSGGFADLPTGITNQDIQADADTVEFLSMTDVVSKGITELDNTRAEDIVSFGYDWLDEQLTGIFPSELVVIGGESGCLHPNTKIYDPINKTNYSVLERYKIGKEFYVYAKNNKKKIVITKAQPPKKFFKTKMYELSNGKEKIIVTGKHRVWDGASFVSVSQLQEFSSFLLPTISGISLLKLTKGALRWKKIFLNFQSYCRPLYHLCGQQLQKVKDIYLDVFPLQDGVLEHSYDCPCMGGQDTKSKYNHSYLSAFLLSKQGSFSLNYRKILNEFCNRLTQGTFSQFFQKHSLICKFCFCLFLFCEMIYKFLSVPVSMVSKIFLNFLDLSYFSKVNINSLDYTTWGVKVQEDCIYYDFTVPKYKNYWASGIFHHNTGKTTFATNVIYKASSKHKCAIYALEDRLEDYGIKALYFKIGAVKKAAEGKAVDNYSWNDFRRREIDDKKYPKYLAEAKKQLANENIYFAKVEKMMNIDLLEELIKRQVKEGIKTFLIDHLHYFDLFSKTGSKADYIERVMVRLKTLQRITGARILLVVHYKKLEGKKPTLDSFKDSISIVQNANYVINIWRDRSISKVEKHKQFITKFFIPKARNPNGEAMVEVEFNPETGDYRKLGDWMRGTETNDIKSDNELENLMVEKFGGEIVS